MYTIKDISKITGLTYHTIRYYTDQQLIPDVTRDENNNRLFSERSVRIFQCLRHLRNSGLTIKELKVFIDLGEQGDDTVLERKDIMSTAKKRLKQQIDNLEESMKYLNYKEDFYEGILEENTANKSAYKK